jgi:hypothetical protein
MNDDGKSILWIGDVIRTTNHVNKSRRWRRTFETEKEAAKGVDMYLISIREEPINIFKRVVR